MDIKVTTLAGKDAGKLKISDEIFGLDPREDILHRVVRWQLAEKQQGTHKTKGRSEIAHTGAKMYRQKGTGRARHSSARVPQFRGGVHRTPRPHQDRRQARRRVARRVQARDD